MSGVCDLCGSNPCLCPVPEQPAADRLSEIRARVARQTFSTWLPMLQPAPSPENIVSDAVYAADARTDVPWLLSEIDRLTADLDAARAELAASQAREAALVNRLKGVEVRGIDLVPGVPSPRADPRVWRCRMCEQRGEWPRGIAHRERCAIGTLQEILAARTTG